MKTDTIFYQLFQEFPNLFFEIIGQPDANISAYQLTAPEIKQRAFRLDILFSTRPEFANVPLYVVEIQTYKDENFYERLFGSTFLYFSQYKPINSDWYAIVIYDRRSHETPAHPHYRFLMEHHVRCIYLDELGETADESLGMAILKLVVESPRNTGDRARQLIDKTREELTDALIQEKVVQWIETIVLYKFPKLSREEVVAMLDLMPELRGTPFYDIALEEGIEIGKQQTKLQMIPLLLELGLSIQQIAQRLELDEDTITEIAEQS